MARFQTLPDRIDCVCSTVNDQVGCLSYGNVIDCCVIYANTKCQLNVMSSCCCAWTVPPGVCSFFVEIWGAGGGGSGNGNCFCCSTGSGGGSGGYVSTTIPTKPGCVYTICAGAGGVVGCGTCGTGSGQTSYITGLNAGNLCAVGGTTVDSYANQPCACLGQNRAPGGMGYCSSTFAISNIFMACGESGHQFGQGQGCRFETRGGAAPFNGGTAGWQSYQNGCNYSDCGCAGAFPGGGGSGAPSSCCCTRCNCGGCGGNGLVRIWY